MLQGFRATAIEGVAPLRQLAESDEAFDIAILNISMPGEVFLSLARHLRERIKVGIVMVTASGGTVNRIVRFEMGAEDYVAKPVELREIMAWIEAVLYRTAARTGVKSRAMANAGSRRSACASLISIPTNYMARATRSRL